MLLNRLLRPQSIALAFVLGIPACGTADQVCTGNVAPAPYEPQAAPRTAFEQIPLYFIENQGQLDSSVAYSVQGLDKSLFFTPQGVSWVLNGPAATPPGRASRGGGKASIRGGHAPFPPILDNPPLRWAVKLDFVGANPNVVPQGRNVTPTTVSFFKGPEEQWKTGLRTYTTLVYPDLWPGIDLVYSGVTGELKYSFTVRPGADPGQIKLAYRGATAVTLAESGRLKIATPAGSFEDASPYTYQMTKGRRVEIASRYVLDPTAAPDTHAYSFHVGEYDKSQPLVVDPAVLVYSSLLGGNGMALGQGLAIDNEGNAYVTGFTSATDFPATAGSLSPLPPGGFDAFIAKLNAAGTDLVYATYLGGTGTDVGIRIQVDGEGNAYAVGYTASLDFPRTPLAHDTSLTGASDAFVVKLDATGTNLRYATYLGGSGSEEGFGIAVDREGNAYVSGDTTSADFPITPAPPGSSLRGMQDAFVTKLNATGTALVYSTYLGGAGIERGWDIALDGNGNAYVTGDTTSSNFPTTPGALGTLLKGKQDGFVTKVDAGGTALYYSTYLGGSNTDDGVAIAVDGDGNAYVTGTTFSSDFPTRGNFGTHLHDGGDAFVAKLNATGTMLHYAGMIGGAGADDGIAVAVDTDGNAYVAGGTSSDDFPAKGPSGNTLNGTRDAFIARVRASGTGMDIIENFGGPSFDEATGLAVDATGHAFIAGTTFSGEPTVGPSLDPNAYRFFDAFIMKLEWNMPEHATTPCGDRDGWASPESGAPQ